MVALANVIAYVVVFGLPIWLVAEGIAHRFSAMRRAQSLAPATVQRRALQGVRVHA